MSDLAGDLSVSVDLSLTPNNGEFVSAITVTVPTDGATYTSAVIDNTWFSPEDDPLASTDVLDPDNKNQHPGWWKYTPTNSGTATLANVSGAGFVSGDVFTGANIQDLVRVATFGPNDVAVTADETYWLRLSSVNGATNYQLSVQGPNTEGWIQPVIEITDGGDHDDTGVLSGTWSGTLDVPNAIVTAYVDEVSQGDFAPDGDGTWTTDPTTLGVGYKRVDLFDNGNWVAWGFGELPPPPTVAVDPPGETFDYDGVMTGTWTTPALGASPYVRVSSDWVSIGEFPIDLDGTWTTDPTVIPAGRKYVEFFDDNGGYADYTGPDQPDGSMIGDLDADVTLDADLTVDPPPSGDLFGDLDADVTFTGGLVRQVAVAGSVDLDVGLAANLQAALTDLAGSVDIDVGLVATLNTAAGTTVFAPAATLRMLAFAPKLLDVTVTLVAPIDATFVPGRRPVFTVDAVTYDYGLSVAVEYSTTATFDSVTQLTAPIEPGQSVIRASLPVVVPLSDDTTYYWRAYAFNANDRTPATTARSFTVNVLDGDAAAGGTWDVRTDTTGLPHLWFTYPNRAKPGDTAHALGTGFGPTTVTVTIAGHPAAVTAFTTVAPGGDAYTEDREINAGTGLATPGHQSIAFTVPTVPAPGGILYVDGS